MDLNPSEQARLETVMAKKQAKEMMKMFFKVTADCFDTCVTDFSSKALSAREVPAPPLFPPLLYMPCSADTFVGSMYQKMH